MIKLAIQELTPGMVTAAPVYTPSGQLILPEHSILTTQQISRLEFYEISTVAIIPESELAQGATLESLLNVEEEEILTYSQQVRRSKDFHQFRADYSHRVKLLRSSLNDLVKKNTPLDAAALLEQVNTLYQERSTSLSIFDMLHNMRQIDDSTFAHCINVSLISRIMGKWLELDSGEVDILTLAGLFHDLGKCMVPDEILTKPASLTDAEFDEIKKHPRYGAEILEHQTIDSRIKLAALMHHERCDGSGYPLGLSGPEIDDFAKIVSIADVYDAMTSNRCYRKGLCPFEVIATFERDGLKKYDSKYILTFLERIVDTYVNNSVLLSDGMSGKIVLINHNALSRPVVHTAVDEYVNLEKHPELYIQAII